MARKTESIFYGDIKDLALFLHKKMDEIEKEVKKASNQKRIKRLEHYLFMMEEVLDLDYFLYGPNRSMPELLSVASNDYRTIKEELVTAQKGYEEIIKTVQEKYKAMGGRIAHCWDDDYDSPMQREYRELGPVYDMCQGEVWWRENECRKLHWLMGIIHRPMGFFEKLYL